MEEKEKILKNYFEFYSDKYDKEDFKEFFTYKIDLLIKSLLPVDYEFNLEIENFYSRNIKKFSFFESVIIPRLTSIIKDHKAYLELEAIQLKNSNVFNVNDNPYDKKGIIKLSEKSFNELRLKLLLMLLIEFIDESLKSETLSYQSDMLFESKAKDLDILNLSKYISYYKESDEYFFYIEFYLEDYLTLILNPSKAIGDFLYDQLTFWFNFLCPLLNLHILSLNYEHFFYDIDINIQNIDDLSSKIIYLQTDYNKFIQSFIKSCTIYDNIITFYNKRFWIEEILQNISLNNKEVIEKIDNFPIKINNLQQLLSLINSMKHICNHMIINLYGKYSVFEIEKFMINKIKENQNVKTIMINMFNFDNFEYLTLIKNSNDIMQKITSNAINIISAIGHIIKRANKDNLKLITIQIKEFTSYKSYMKDIMRKFNEMIRDILLYRVNFILSFNDVSTDANENSITFNSKSYDVEDTQSDLMLLLPNLNLEPSTTYNKYLKLKHTSEPFCYVTLFEKNLKIMSSSTLDYYYLRNYRMNIITNMKLGYFNTIVDLYSFLNKLNFLQLHNLTKVTFYLKSNKGFSYDNIGKIFTLNWPKNKLKQMKILYEKEHSFSKFDVYTLYSDFIYKHYFSTKTNEDIKNMQKIQSTLINNKRPLISTSFNDTSMRSTYLLQNNYSMLMELTSYVNKRKDKSIFSLFPLSFILFSKIDTYLDFHPKANSLYSIAIEIPFKNSFNKSLEKQKLKDKFINSILISEYSNIITNLTLFYAMEKYDKMHKTKITKMLSQKVRMKNMNTNINIFQLIFKFLKEKRVIFCDFKNSSQVFKKFKDILN